MMAMYRKFSKLADINMMSETNKVNKLVEV
jgi:hypothetical protein